MNITEALAFDTVQANFDVENNLQNNAEYHYYDVCDADYARKAHDVIAILQIEIKRLKSLPDNYGVSIAKYRYRDLTAVSLPACIDYNLDTGNVVCLPAVGQAGQDCGPPYSDRWVRLVANKFSINR